MISCKDYVNAKKQELRAKIAKLERKPKLCVIQVGDNPASNSYISGKRKDCEEVGIECEIKKLDENTSQTDLATVINSIAYSDTDGIIVQLPLPNHINADEITKLIPVEKDVDGFRGEGIFKPCTPKGIVDWLKFNKYDFVGKNAVVIGRSNIVGKPLTSMLIDEGATVTCCNSHSDVMKYTRTADLVISAVGKPKVFNFGYFTTFKPNIIVDVGINRGDDGKLCGDIDHAFFDSKLPKTYVTPVPGGVGLLTRYALLENVYEASMR